MLEVYHVMWSSCDQEASAAASSIVIATLHRMWYLSVSLSMPCSLISLTHLPVARCELLGVHSSERGVSLVHCDWEKWDLALQRLIGWQHFDNGQCISGWSSECVLYRGYMVCVCVCVCMYVCMCVHKCVHACVCVCMCACVHVMCA